MTSKFNSRIPTLFLFELIRSHIPIHLFGGSHPNQGDYPHPPKGHHNRKFNFAKLTLEKGFLVIIMQKSDIVSYLLANWTLLKLKINYTPLKIKVAKVHSIIRLEKTINTRQCSALGKTLKNIGPYRSFDH